MGLKIVISASRYSSEKQSVISELKKLNTSQRTIIAIVRSILLSLVINQNKKALTEILFPHAIGLFYLHH